MAQPSVRAYLTWLATALIQGTVSTSNELMAELEQAIQTLAQGLSATVDWMADTDQGPSRDRNEDACYPQGQAQQQVLTSQVGGDQPLPLLLVCDGIGGHEHGNVASQTAIKLLLEELQPLAQQPDLSPAVVAQRLKQAITLANNAISNRNNDEQRSARARMGTTVVVALVHFPYVSIAHLGDSRAYRISTRTCYQITLDDDVASREAHLGYALYQEAVHMPGGGALIQALGINDSGYLYPAVQYLCVDDPSVLLLCSDGLSDYDRVDALWLYTARSLVGNTAPLAPVAQQLIQQANRLNGHDNVTVGLMRFLAQTASLPTLPAQRLRSQVETAASSPPARTELAPVPVGTTALAQPVVRRPWRRWLGGAAAALLVLGGAGWAYWLRQPQPIAITPVIGAWPTADLAGQPLLPLALALTADISVGSFWRVSPAVSSPVPTTVLQLTPSPTLGTDSEAAPSSATTAPVVPAGSVLKVVSRQTLADQTDWVRLQVCSIPSGRSLADVPTESDQSLVEPSAATLAQQLSQPGDEGWAKHYHLYSAATTLDTVTPTQAGVCSS
jgi:serine/threonine protein phosphatase PrpC